MILTHFTFNSIHSHVLLGHLATSHGLQKISLSSAHAYVLSSSIMTSNLYFIIHLSSFFPLFLLPIVFILFVSLNLFSFAYYLFGFSLRWNVPIILNLNFLCLEDVEGVNSLLQRRMVCACYGGVCIFSCNRAPYQTKRDVNRVFLTQHFQNQLRIFIKLIELDMGKRNGIIVISKGSNDNGCDDFVKRVRVFTNSTSSVFFSL